MLKRFFKKLFNALKTVWVLALFVALLLILLIWLVGPLIAVAEVAILDGVIARLVASIAVIFCWGLFVAIYYSGKRKKELADPEKAARHERGQQDKQRLKGEVHSIMSRVKEAIKIVTSANFYGPTSRSRYTLPWYLIIGTANSGKTSLLLNSGLQFPLNEQADRHLYELKATERCEFLYANQAVFIDTPGVYTESRGETEQHRFWTVLLNRIFRARPAKPLNGVIVCVSIRELMSNDAARREHVAKNIRARLSEVLKRLHAYVPIYLVFTKCDAVPGFAQFFAHLSRAEREQIFGCPASEKTMESEDARKELKNLMQTLNGQIISKIHQERDIVARGNMFRFPQELAGLGPRIEDFVFEAFGPSRYHKPTMFRGFFFSSSLSVHDVLSSSSRQGEASFQSGFQPALGEYAKGFFLLRLLLECILPEARLASSDKEHRWGLRLKRHGLQMAGFAFFLFAATFLGISFMNNYSRITAIDKSYLAFAEEKRTRPAIITSKQALPELWHLSTAAHTFDPAEDSSISLGLGLYQGNNFDQAADQAYLLNLNQRLLPLVRSEAGERLVGKKLNLAELKTALCAYLMLYQPEHINEKFLLDWLREMWSEHYLGDAETQHLLGEHMQYLIRNGLLASEPDAKLVADARTELLKIPPAELAYQRMQEEAAASGNLPYTVRASFAGALSPFTGDDYEIPYLYTKAGFMEYCIKRSPAIIDSLTADSWIYGPRMMTLSAVDVQKLYKDVRAMYFLDYTKRWSEAVNQLKVRKPSGLGETAKLAEQFTTGISPATIVLRDLRANLTLAFTAEGLGDGKDAAMDAVAGKVGQKTGRVGRVLAEQGLDNLAERQAASLEELQKDAIGLAQHFAPLDGLLDENGNPKPILSAAQDEMANAGAYFQKLAASDRRDERVFNALLDISSEKDDTLRNLETAAGHLPQPIRDWYLSVMSYGLDEMLMSTARHINKDYVERILTVYNSELRHYYPFNSKAERDVNLDAFTSFFRPGGTLDSFNNGYLRQFITNRGELRSVMGRRMPFSPRALSKLQKAKQVQNAFFNANGELSVSFLMEPYSMDATLKRVDILNGDKSLGYWHGPVKGVNITWPVEYGAPAQASLLTTNLQGYVSYVSARGDWALFRVFEHGSIKKQVGNTSLIQLKQNDKWIDLQIQYRNRANPLDPSVCAFVLEDSLF